MAWLYSTYVRFRKQRYSNVAIFWFPPFIRLPTALFWYSVINLFDSPRILCGLAQLILISSDLLHHVPVSTACKSTIETFGVEICIRYPVFYVFQIGQGRGELVLAHGQKHHYASKLKKKSKKLNK
jgi:hypothetical protein